MKNTRHHVMNIKETIKTEYNEKELIDEVPHKKNSQKCGSCMVF